MRSSLLLIIIQGMILSSFSCNLLAKQAGIPASQYQIESTLEVLQGAELYPTESMLCGPSCLYIGARYLGIDQHSIDEIARMADWNFADGTNMLGLQNACRKMSLYAEAFELNTNQLADLMSRYNALAVIESKNHYYVLLKADNGKFFCGTTPLEAGWVEAKKLAELWDGKALLFSTSPIDVEIGYSKYPLFGGLLGFALIGVVGIGYLLRKSDSTRRKIGANKKTISN